ncbi:O-antigen ligase [Flavobacterium sp. NKUCC04_CG]|uniref:O-antigen ligase family protein n=1 Tax=Flavobacterium sp. NKUCC04_CG TaxID=2842121 RepID=UPI001C5BDDFB|nr:O-antigen ligase family protein [Flavobacterium sp. NKUCC04_CG]MBW3518883.1 O-antigen ligase family protein [Flavobacterium sp. NKUCC04_CG]
MYRKAIGLVAFIFGAALPLSTKMGNVALGVLMGLLLILVVKERAGFERKSFKKQLFLSTVIVFFMVIYGLLFTSDLPKGMTIIGRSISYLAVPAILFFVSRNLLKNLKNSALKGIIYGTTVAAIILLSNNFIKYFSFKKAVVIDSDLFNYYYTYLEFASILKMHPTYLGMYFLTALSALLFVKLSIDKSLKIALGLLFLLTIVFLNSRTVLLFTIVLLFLILIRVLKGLYTQKKLFFYGLIVLVSFVAVGSYQLFKGTYVYSRITTELSWELSTNVNSKYNNKHSADSRWSRWIVTRDLIKEKPIFGYGTGSSETLLKELYVRKGLTNSAQSNYDTHNQYLHITIEFGVVGLLLFLFYLVGNVVRAIKLRNWISVSFFAMILICSAFENIFKFNEGVIFIAFFSNIYMFLNTRE